MNNLTGSQMRDQHINSHIEQWWSTCFNVTYGTQTISSECLLRFNFQKRCIQTFYYISRFQEIFILNKSGLERESSFVPFSAADHFQKAAITKLHVIYCIDVIDSNLKLLFYSKHNSLECILRGLRETAAGKGRYSVSAVTLTFFQKRLSLYVSRPHISISYTFFRLPSPTHPELLNDLNGCWML